MKTIQLNNYTVHYVEEGSGSPVIFVHGSISDYRGWEAQLSPFAKQFQVFAYSRRYHYPSDSDEIDIEYTVPNHARDLTAYIESLNLDAVNLVGSSYGAYASLLTAIKHPDKIRTLVLGEPPVIPLLLSNPNNPLQILSLLIRDLPTGKSFLKFGMKAMFPATKQLRKGNLDEGVRLFANGVLGSGGFEKMSEERKSKLLDNAKALRAELLYSGFPELSKKDYSSLNVPALLICGEKSPAFFRSLSDKLHNLLPDSEKIVIPGVSHNMHMARPKIYNRKVMDFLKKHN